MEDALCCLARKEAGLPLWTMMYLPDDKGLLGIMPGYIENMDSMGVKVVSVVNLTPDKKQTSHEGFVLLFSIKTGKPLVLLDAHAITALRTAATSAVASSVLSRNDAATVAILGSGVQAYHHLQAMQLVREINTVFVWSLPLEHGHEFVDKCSKQYPHLAIKLSENTSTAVKDADIICTTTAAKDPILFGKDIKPGAHINAVGSCTPNNRELDTEAVCNSRLYVDRKESILQEAGDFIIPKNQGVINNDFIQAEIGDVLIGRKKGRNNDQEITLFKSLGLSIEDIAAAHYIYTEACRTNRGMELEL